jgi:hypothetical protein
MASRIIKNYKRRIEVIAAAVFKKKERWGESKRKSREVWGKGEFCA